VARLSCADSPNASYFLEVGFTSGAGFTSAAASRCDIIGAGGAGRSLISRCGLPNASALMISCVKPSKAMIDRLSLAIAIAPRRRRCRSGGRRRGRYRRGSSGPGLNLRRTRIMSALHDITFSQRTNRRARWSRHSALQFQGRDMETQYRYRRPFLQGRREGFRRGHFPQSYNKSRP
jgi:hypothetical protein